MALHSRFTITRCTSGSHGAGGCCVGAADGFASASAAWRAAIAIQLLLGTLQTSDNHSDEQIVYIRSHTNDDSCLVIERLSSKVGYPAWDRSFGAVVVRLWNL